WVRVELAGLETRLVRKRSVAKHNLCTRVGDVAPALDATQFYGDHKLAVAFLHLTGEGPHGFGFGRLENDAAEHAKAVAAAELHTGIGVHCGMGEEFQVQRQRQDWSSADNVGLQNWHRRDAHLPFKDLYQCSRRGRMAIFDQFIGWSRVI